MSWQDPSRWPYRRLAHDGPKVLVEDQSPSWRWRTVRALVNAGYDVACCEGPDHAQCSSCPLVDGASCLLAQEADAIVFGLRLEMNEARAVLEALRPLAKPIVVELTDPAVVGDLGTGLTLVPYTTNGSAIVSAVAQLVGPRERRSNLTEEPSEG